MGNIWFDIHVVFCLGLVFNCGLSTSPWKHSVWGKWGWTSKHCRFHSSGVYFTGIQYWFRYINAKVLLICWHIIKASVFLGLIDFTCSTFNKYIYLTMVLQLFISMSIVIGSTTKPTKISVQLIIQKPYTGSLASKKNPFMWIVGGFLQ